MTRALSASKAERAGQPSLRLQNLLLKGLSHALLAIFTIIIVYPVVWMVMASFKNQNDFLSNPWGLPQSYEWMNYVQAWERAKLGNALFNSVVISFLTVVIVIVLAALAGYAFARFSFRFSTAILLLFILTMQAPVPIIPLYVMMVRMQMTNSYWGLILPMVAGSLPLAIFIFQAFFRGIPREIQEAAVVDGCTQFSAFWRVIVPISSPAFATVAILEFLGAWNQYFLALILIRSPEMRTLPLAIQVFFYEWGRSEWEQVFAALSIGSIPMIIVYIIMQRQFIQGLTSGAVKG
jgi:raffinose/stachyose/melibiose transport system permease protein